MPIKLGVRRMTLEEKVKTFKLNDYFCSGINCSVCKAVDPIFHDCSFVNLRT